MPSHPHSTAAPFDILALVTPVGGLEALLAELPAELPAAVLVCGEVPPVEVLSHHTPLPAHWAQDGTVLQPGHLYLSPPHLILEVRPDGRCAVTPRGELPSERPLDRLLASLAVGFGERALAAIVGSPGRDGVAGARALRGTGGTVLVGDPATADPADLPRAVVEAGAADLVRSPGEIGPTVAALLAGRPLPVLPGGAATERARAGEARARLGTDYRTLFDALDEGVCIIEVLFDERSRAVDYRFLETNPAFERQTGIERGVGRTMREIAPTHEDFWFEVYGEVARTGGAKRFEHQAEALGRFYDVYAFRIGEPRQHRVAILFKDISGRKQAERDLRATNQLLQTVFDSSLEYLQLFQAVRDERGSIADFEWRLTNKPWNDQWGEMAGKRLLTENPAVIETGLFEKFKQVTESGVPDTHEHYYAHEQFDGWFFQTAAKAGDGFLLSTLDITERKRAEEELQASEARQAFLLKLSDRLRALTDPRQVHETAARLLVEHLGVAWAYYFEVGEDEDTVTILGGHSTGAPLHLPPGTRISDFGAPLLPVFTRGQTVVYADVENEPGFTEADREAFRQTGARAAIAVPLLEEGRFVAHLGVSSAQARQWTAAEVALVEDVAQRTWAVVGRARAEAALRESEQKYRTLFETMGQGYVLAELVRDDAGRATDLLLLDVNPAYERLMGVRAEDARGRRVYDLFPQVDRWWLENYDRIVRAGQPERLEYRYNDLGGWFEAWVYPREQNRFIALFEDITKRKRREANQELLAELSKDLGQPSGEEELLHTVGARLAAHLGLTCYHYVDVDEDRAEVTVRHFWHALDVPPVLGTYPIDGFIPRGGLGRLRAGETTVIGHIQNDLSGDTAATAGLRAGAAAQQIGAFVAVPYSQDGRWKAYFAVADSRPREWTGPEIELVQEVASRVFPRVERARAEEALRASEARLQLALDAARMGTFVWSPGADRGEADARLLSLYGLGPNDPLNHARGLAERVVPEDRARHAEAVAAALDPNGDGVLRSEYRITRADDGAERWIATLGQVQFTRPPGGEPPVALSLTGVSEDITERKRAERRQAFLLRFSDALRPLRDATAIQKAAMEVLGAHLNVDRAFFTEILPDGDTVVTRTDYLRGVPSLVGTMRLSDFGPRVREAYAAGKTVVTNDVLVDWSPTGAERAAYASIQFVAGIGVPLVKEGRLLGIVTVHMATPRTWTGEEVSLLEDVAERTWAAVERARAEAALTESEDRLRALVEHLPGGAVFVVDHDLRYLLAQGEALAASGFTPEDLIGRTVAEAMEPELVAHHEALYRQALAGEEFEHEHAAHGRAFVTRGVPLRNAAGDISAALAVSYDITERRRAEEVLRKNQERQAFLLGLSDTLRPLADPTAVQSEAARVLGRHLGASRASYAEVEADDAHVVVHHDYADGVPSYAGRYLLGAFGPGFVRDLRAGRTVTLADAGRDARVSEAERTEVYAAGAIRAFIGVPLVKGGRLAAVFSLHFPTAHEWTPDEVALVEEVAERTWAAVERARAEEDLRALNATLEERVAERTRRLATLNSELASRTRALEAFAELTRGLAPHLDPHVLIRRGQEIALSLLPGGFATYYEPEGTLWRLRAQVGDMRNPALQAAVDAGLPVGGTPSLDRPWASGAPLFQGQYDRGADGLGDLEPEVDAVATFPLTVDGARLGVFAVALFSGRAWSVPDRAVLETVVRSLGLALERAAAVRALAEEREALAAFARFTELTADTGDVIALARRAAEVLHTTLNVHSAVYFEREGGRWRARHVSGSVAPGLESFLYEGGLPERTPSFALPAARREPMFFEPWEAGADGFPEAASAYRAVARYPLFPTDHPVGLLGMATTARPAWTEREKAVFRAVGDSFRLALERTARTQQIERQRERLADLNAELGNFITRTAHNLEAPARRLGHLLDPGRPLDPRALEGLPPYDPALLHDEVMRLRGVAQDLRQLSSLEGHDLAKDLLPLGELFAEVQAQGSGTPRGEGVHWLVEPLPIVRGDRALLRQAMEVLMAFTLSETRGARYVTVGSREVDGEVQVTVEDDGVGLSGEEAATLFDLAVRTDQSVPVFPGGGLAQVRRILARHGGWAWAEARRSSGKIVLAFPRDEAVNELEALLRLDRPGR